MSLAFCICCLTASHLQLALDRSARFFNASISVAATFSNGSSLALASGLDDHSTGTLMTTASLFPSGSVTKTFTAVAALRLADQGKLDLDAPFHKLVDPWLKAQGKPSLRELWGGNATIERVSARQLLGQRSGVPDYDDAKVRDWTLAHPDADLLPSSFVSGVDKTFLFEPGSGGSYSGVGYVLLGWVLCAATEGCNTWSDLDLKALTRPNGSSLLTRTHFMGAGRCRTHPGVVHQYLYDPGAPGRRRLARRSWPLQPPLELGAVPSRRGADWLSMATWRHRAESTAAVVDAVFDAPSTSPRHCTAHSKKTWYEDVELTGPSVGEVNITSGGAESCCAASDGANFSETVAYWTYVPTGGLFHRDHGTCRFFGISDPAAIKGKANLGATSGRADPKVSPRDFVDLIDASCLNGWTMGNIATTPREATQWYHALFAGQILTSSSLKAMMTFEKLTVGFAAGASYGLGLFHDELVLPLKGIHLCRGLPGCECGLFTGCHFRAETVGHAGLDYGSGMPLIGFLPALNLSYAVAVNVGESTMGMNTSMGLLENVGFLESVYCELFDSIVHEQMPSYPAFECSA